jgi:hypothetical protein
MRPRAEEDYVSTLPMYVTKRSEDFPGWLLVTCPREDCAEVFIVRRSRWTSKLIRRDRTVTGRSCPYCFRSARIPKRT